MNMSLMRINEVRNLFVGLLLRYLTMVLNVRGRGFFTGARGGVNLRNERGPRRNDVILSRGVPFSLHDLSLDGMKVVLSMVLRGGTFMRLYRTFVQGYYRFVTTIFNNLRRVI